MSEMVVAPIRGLGWKQKKNPYYQHEGHVNLWFKSGSDYKILWHAERKRQATEIRFIRQVNRS